MAERVTVPSAFLRSLPPWLQRRVGAAVAGGIADVLETVVQETAAGVRARFPTDDVDAAALAQIGAERRIRRGPSEATATYAARLRTWWDAHRHRGSPYELLRQLWGFFHSSLPMRMDVVSQLGNRHYLLDTATSGEADQVVHDGITWTGNGATGEWAHLWVFFYVTGLFDVLVTASDEVLVTEAGDQLVATSIFAGVISDEDAEMFCAIPREWSAAHVPYVTVVLLYGTARLWNYPQPITDTWGSPPARTWASPDPVILIAE